MLDDEIVCLGSFLSAQHCVSGAQQQISGERAQSLCLRHDSLIAIAGVIFHVDKTAESQECTMLFKRSNVTVVNIGRRSGSEPDRSLDEDLTSAMFRCAVVSRKHAKIVFSDCGNVCILYRCKLKVTHSLS